MTELDPQIVPTSCFMELWSQVFSYPRKYCSEGADVHLHYATPGTLRRVILALSFRRPFVLSDGYVFSSPTPPADLILACEHRAIRNVWAE